ncbi:mechanosensitive ion channel family protein [Pedobacter rhizosphaerae]|uniref:Small-conductance mechanosensitive channel n=1 Tax=Pedobacter rhizosphaerae TaxID=390241 RepID=A0A1H9N9G4_9SPHI|nr:mechanosensitive ion channel domain-containing protein [Pedobacter rhizosphaerae]SER32387.1 Small-conductance mechanosensitive channel [Pedobacter rhizosphaerae]
MFFKNFLRNSGYIFLVIVLSFLFQTVCAQEHHPKKAKIDTNDLDESQVPVLVNKIETYNFSIDRNRFLLQREYDVSAIKLALPGLEKKVKGFKTRFEKNSSKMNLRSLNSSVILLAEVSENLSDYKTTLSGYAEQLTKSNAALKKILSDAGLKVEVEDSTLRTQQQEILVEGKRLATEQLKALNNINLLNSRISVAFLQTKNLASDMQYLSISKKISMWSREVAPLFEAKPADYEDPFLQIIGNAFQRSFRIIKIYLAGKISIVVLSLFIFGVLTVWMISNMRRIKKLEDAESILRQVKFLNGKVVIGSLFAFFTYVPFLFGNPTMSLLHLLELLRLLTLCLILPTFLTQQGRLMWFSLCVLWVFYAIDDILLDAAFGERWGLFMAGILLLAICVKIYRSKEGLLKAMESSPATKALSVFTVIQVALSLFFNLTGRLSLAKIFGVSAVECLMLGITLKVFCNIVLEAIYMQTEAYQSSRFSDFINYKSLQHRLQRYLWVLASLVFFISFVRSITLYDLLTTSTANFFYETRSIGSYKFTFASIAIFICIIWLSSVISSFISFFFGHEKAVAGGKRSGLNSMMLLIRLAIWTVGFLIAVAAAGIPIDKLSIMLGALGVGIGFGLQNIVNNLVSGVIIAFERPIQIGDQIEIGTKSGVVKEIGVRSSKIHSAEGSDIIVPNGDLLSQHLINWTMQDRSKRMEFTIGIPYSADVEAVRKLIADKLALNEKVLKLPKPVIIIQDFGEYSIGIRTLIWVADLSVAGEVRTEAMIDVKRALTEAGIELQIRPLS